MTSERLLIYPPKDSDSREKSVLVLFFGISAFFVGLFSITRLFRVHWVFLVPLSLGSLALFMAAVLYFRMREKPLKALWVEGDSLCILLDPGTPGASPSRYPLSSIRVESKGEGVPTEIRIFRENDPLLSLALVQVRNVTLYCEIARFLQRLPDTFFPLDSEKGEKSVGKGKFFWVVLPWALIVILMAAWEIYENHLAPRNYGPFSNP